MIDQSNWKAVESIVRQVVHKWDPYSLLQSGAPEDEWDGEIKQVVGRLNRCDSPTLVASEMSDVFTRAFQPEGFSPEDCAEVGMELFEALKKANLK